jgi:hypothetical protein
MNSRCVLLLLALSSASVHAQTIDDGVMLPKRGVLAGNVYTYDTWDEYWEGTLKRENGNIGTLTTETNVWSGNYGITDRFNVIGMVPYVWTSASQGVLHGIQGFQDITVAGKYQLFEKQPARIGTLRAIVVGAVSIPLTDYNPELLPLSIGMGSARLSPRGTAKFQTNPGWFAEASAAYTWRSDVTLDRPYYYSNGEFVMSDHVDMPNVFDHVERVGYMKGAFMTAVSYSQQRTLGGGDIRRQDMPFVADRMNSSRVGAMVMTPIPKLRALLVQAAVAQTVDGRNVGRATTFTGGIFYRRFRGSQIQ